MRLLDKYNCIFCKYKKYNKNHDFACMDIWEKDAYGYPVGKCNSLSNIYYGKLTNYFPFKQIDWWLSERVYKKEEKYSLEMDEKYGNAALEDDDMKFVWGVKSWDDLSGSECNFYTMNDIDIIYDKQSKEYQLSIETAYMFNDHAAECEYLHSCLNAFETYMDDNKMQKDKPFLLFMSDCCTSMRAKTIEDLYTSFKIFVDGFCNQNISMEDKRED